MNKPHKEYSKAIKALSRKAEKGVLEAQYQLYESYSSGNNVEKIDFELAEKYLNAVKQTIKFKKFRLKKMAVYNFRRFKKLEIDFDEHVTVIIGDNGAGKTSIVEAISKMFTWFNNNLEKDDVNGKPITISDINIQAKDFAEVSCHFELDENNYFNATLGRRVAGYSGSTPTHVATLKQFAEMYRKIAQSDLITIPLLAYYSSERSAFELKQMISEKSAYDISINRFEALKDALDGSGEFESFSELYIELVNLAEGQTSKEIRDLKTQISNLQEILNDVYGPEKPSEDDRVLIKLIERQNKLSDLLKDTNFGKYERCLWNVNYAIEKLVPDVKNIEVDRSKGKPRIMLENFGVKINISQLSKGQKTMVALAGDIARRLVFLNPDEKTPLNGPGVVIIDEIELHLHPKWQQEIIVGLQKTFPNIQFIITTHSPQVLSTVDKTSIRKIYLNDDGEPIVGIPTFQTKGVTSADVLTRIMEINSVPENIEEADWLNKFSEFLLKGDELDMNKYYKKILNHFGENHPVVLDCQSQIRISEMTKKWSEEK